MSIYSGPIFEFYPAHRPDRPESIRVFAMSVSAHIGCLDGSEPDTYGDFLPPPVSENSEFARAVVFIGPNSKKGTARSGQEYERPLFVITGEECNKATFIEIMERITKALNEQGYYTQG